MMDTILNLGLNDDTVMGWRNVLKMSALLGIAIAALSKCMRKW